MKSDETDIEMKDDPISNQKERKEERERDEEEESRASKAIRTHQPKGEKSKRDEDGISEQPNNKVIRTTGESRGEVTRDVITRKPQDVRVTSGDRMVDAIDSVEWEEEKDALRETRVPIIRITGGNRNRGIH